MKTTILIFLGIFFFWHSPNSFASMPLGNFDLTLNFEKIKYRTSQGKIGIAIYKHSQGFPQKQSAAYQRLFIDGNNRSHTISLPEGNYAIAIFHDLNRNRKLDKRKLFGIPKEPIGFSRNPKLTFGAPKFSQCKFNLSSHKQITINLKYYAK